MDMKQKITKILEKAASTTSEAEAETLMAKARQMMEEHQIDASELGEKELITTWVTGEFQKGTIAQVKYRVEAEVSRYYGCRPIIITFAYLKGEKPRALYEMSGPESALVTARLMFPFIWKQITAAARNEAKGMAWSDKEEKKLTRRYTETISDALMERLQRLREVPAAPVARTEAAKNALIVLGNDVDAYVAGRYPDLGEAKIRNSKADRRAHALAASIRLEQQMGGQGALQIGSLK